MKASLKSNGIVVALSLVITGMLSWIPGLAAQTATWDGGGGNGRWSDAANWVGDQLPAAGNQVVIPAGSGEVRVDTAVTIGNSLEVQTGSTLIVGSGMTLTLNGFAFGGGAIINDGVIEESGGQGEIGKSGPSSLATTPVLTNNAGALMRGIAIWLNSARTFDNHGTLDNVALFVRAAGAVFNNDGLIVDAALSVAGPPRVPIANNLASGRITGGTLTVGSPTVFIPSLQPAQPGVFNNEGIIEAAVIHVYWRFNNTGTVDLTAGGGLTVHCDDIVLQIGVLNDTGTLLGGPINGDCLVWDGGGDGLRWSDPLNWNLDRVPVSGSSLTDGDRFIYINGRAGAANEIHLDTSFTLRRFGGVVRINGVGTVPIHGDGFTTFETLPLVTFVIDAGVTLTVAEPTAEFTLVTARLVNQGTLINNLGVNEDIVAGGKFDTAPSGGPVTLDNYGLFNNLGKYTNHTGSVTNNFGTLNNTGNINNRGIIVNRCGGVFSGTVIGNPVEQELCDTAPPTISGSRSPAPNAAGWNNSDVVVSFVCTDDESGLAPGSPPPDTVVSTEGAGQSVTATCTDQAGNSASLTIDGINIDKTPPSITGSQRPAANANGWNNTDVTVSFTCSDALSGLAAGSPPADTVVSTEGAGQSATGVCEDLAGNSVFATFSNLNIDKAPPSVTGTPDRTPDGNGWYNHALTVSWAGSDPISGIASCSAPSVYDGPDSATGSLAGSCTDRADNQASASFGFQFDATPPMISMVTSPAGAAYLLNAALASDYSCTDNLSAVAVCAGPVPVGSHIDTASAGTKAFTVNAADMTGNGASLTHSYSVQYGFIGFLPPIHSLPTVNVARAGRAYPVKWQLQDANGTFISDPTSFTSLLSAPIPCDASPGSILEEEVVATGETTLRYDATTNQFIFNWQTSIGWVGCRLLQLTFSDGTQHFARFEFR